MYAIPQDFFESKMLSPPLEGRYPVSDALQSVGFTDPERLPSEARDLFEHPEKNEFFSKLLKYSAI
jgi:hypothetical protein